MKVRELIEILKNYDLDDFVFLTINGATQYFFVDAVVDDVSGAPILESHEAVEFDDIIGLAKECYNENYKMMTPIKRGILEELLDAR